MLPLLKRELHLKLVLCRQLAGGFRILIHLGLVAFVASDRMLELVRWALMLAVG